MSFEHLDPVRTAERTVSNLTPAFGDSFTIEDWSFDDKGHKSGLQSHIVTIPKGSFTLNTSVNSADVITSLSFVDTTGALSATYQSVGSLQLTGYTLPSNPDVQQIQILSSALNASDNLNGGLAKLEYRLNTEITNRTNAVNTATTAASTALTNTIEGLDADLDASGTLQHNGTFVISGVTETDGVITAVDSIEVETAGAAAAALDSAIGSASDASSADTINGAKLYASEVATTAQENAIAAIKTETFTYSPLIANPEYDSSDPTSEEYIRDENNSITKTIED